MDSGAGADSCYGARTMKLTADLHIHSHFSRATSRDLDLPNLSLWAQHKGVCIVGTGDFTHPGWRAELKDKLVPAPGEDGLYVLREDLLRDVQRRVPAACQATVRFALTVEISNIYKKAGAVRKVHNLVLVPSLDVADALSARLARIGNVASDGRPILGLDSRDLLELTLASDPQSYLIPAHIWTPHFSVFGSMSGFDTIEACYGDLTPEIFALETGLSSDPEMNWRWSALDRFTLVSNSDAHSPGKLAREANLLDIAPSFQSMREALRTADPAQFLGTVEFFPEEGKYHLDGHRGCAARLTPDERARLSGQCPVCGKPVTVGVLSRVEALADRPEGDRTRPPRARPFQRLVPLPETIGEALGVGSGSQAVTRVFHRLLDRLGPELHVLREAPLEDIARVGGALVGEAVRRVRAGELHIAAGYDGEYGTVRIFAPEERAQAQERGQTSLFA